MSAPQWGPNLSHYPALENCVHPCSWTYEGGEMKLGRCGSRDETYCPPCAHTYRNRVRLVALGIPADEAEGTSLMLTVTAPGVRAHEVGGQGSGVWCECTPPGGVDLAQWNGKAGEYWNRLLEDLKRKFGLELAYFKVTEVQERGAFHFHVRVRIISGRWPSKAELRALVIHHGFGHEVKADWDKDRADGGKNAAAYCAKYVSKAVTLRKAVPYVHPRTGEVGPGRWCVYSKSRNWGVTMAGVKANQARFWVERPDIKSGLIRAALGLGPAEPALDLNSPYYTEPP